MNLRQGLILILFEVGLTIFWTTNFGPEIQKS